MGRVFQYLLSIAIVPSGHFPSNCFSPLDHLRLNQWVQSWAGKSLIKVTAPTPRGGSYHPFSHARVKSCFQPLQGQGFSYVPMDMSTHSARCETGPDFPSLDSSLLNFTPLVTTLSLWTTANNNSVELTFSPWLPTPSQFHTLLLDEIAWHEPCKRSLHKWSELELG